MNEVIASKDALVSAPVSYLPGAILKPRRPAIALAVAWLLTFPLSIALAAVAAAIFPGAPPPEFNMSGPVALFLLTIFAPVVETLIMGAVLLVLLKVVRPTVAILLSSAGWGIAHSLQAPTWGLVIWWPFLIFSTLFMVWRERSLPMAFVMPAMAHGLHNLPTAAIIAAGVKL